MAMAISAEQPVMPSSLAAKLREQGGTWQVAITILYIVYVIIYIYIHIYPAAPLSENVQSFRNFHLKTSVALHLPCVLRSGMWSGGFCRIWLYDFWWFAGVWHFCCRWFADNSWRVGISIFENTPAFHAEALYAATFESHGPWVLYEYLGVSVRWGVLIIFDIVLHESFRCICLDCSLGPWDCSFHAFIEF